MKKKWSPHTSFKGVVINEFGVRSLEEELQRRSWSEWALKEDAPFTAIPPMKAEQLRAAPIRFLKSQLRQLIA